MSSSQGSMNAQAVQKAVDEQLFQEMRRAGLFEKGRKNRNPGLPGVGKCLLALAWVVIAGACFLACYNALPLVGRVAGATSALAYDKTLAMTQISELREQLAVTISKLEKFEEAEADRKASILPTQEITKEAPCANWFAFYHFNARAIPSQSSPPFRKAVGPVKTPWSPLAIFSKETREDKEQREMKTTFWPDGPNAALVNLQEVGVQPYCGHPSRRKLQLVVQTARPITPLELTIEHSPGIPETHRLHEKSKRPATLGPKEVELWVQLSDATVRDAVREGITLHHPDIMTAKSRERGGFLAKAQELDASWVPIGRWEYDRTTTKMQKFRPNVDLERLGVVSDKFAVRVNSNWGDREQTCLYRTKMRGIDRSGLGQMFD